MDISHQIDWLSRLVAFDTTSSKSNLALIDHVDDYLTGLGASTWRVADATGAKANLYALIGPAEPGGVVLSGHTDVVPVAGQDWSSDPFVLEERDGKFYGRGTCDMKAFSAIALSLAPDMIAADMKRPIILALSYDEEIGCIGAPSMIEEIAARLPTPAAVIVGEPTMMDVIDGHKGIASFRTTVTGYTTHSSQTHRGVSAVEAAARLIARIADMRAARARDADPDCPFDPPHSTMTVNLINGGTQINIMAGTCVFEWDCRALPGETSGDILEEFNDYALGLQTELRARAPSCRIETETMTDVPAFAPMVDNAAADLAKALTGRNATGVVPYAAEAGQFQSAGFPTVICGPGSIDQAHQADEFISREQLVAGTQFIRRLINRLAHA